MALSVSLRLLMSMLIVAVIGGISPSGHAASLLGLEDLGKALGAAADAVGKLGDSIAHLISLGNQGFNAVQAERTRERLKDIDARLVQLNKVANVRIVNTMQEYINIWNSDKQYGIDPSEDMSITES
jgi:hypothetical protein